MPQFLFIVEIPPLQEGSHGVYVSPEFSRFANEVGARTKSVAACKQLQTNAWLLPAENTLPLLMEVAALAAKTFLSYSALLIPDGAVVLALDEKSLG